MIQSNLPSTAEAVLRQNGSDYILTIMHYVPQRRTNSIDIIEDVLPLYDREISVLCPESITKLINVETKQEIPFTRHKDRIHFTVPKIEGYLVLAFG